MTLLLKNLLDAIFMNKHSQHKNSRDFNNKNCAFLTMFVFQGFHPVDKLNP